jgi:hypothetical protein
LRLNLRSVPWDILIALLAGFGLGLVYSWVLSPVEYVNADPSLLRADFKDQYRAVIAAAYASNGDLDRTRARLALLGDPDPIQSLSAQAQQMLAAGEPFERIRQVAQLASDIQQGVVTPKTIPAPSAVSTYLNPTGTSVSMSSTPVNELSSPPATLETPISINTPTPYPTRTPTPTTGAAFALVGQDPICSSDSPSGLLQIMIMDAHRRQVPGVEIIVTWNGGEDRFFTGFKPELGNGFADFQMEHGVAYSVQVMAGGAPVSNVIAPQCTGQNGEVIDGGLLLTFQQQQ